MMSRSRSFWTPLYTNTLCMSSRAKVQNHYDILNVQPSATQEEIKSAYYKLSKEYHPDRNSSAEAKTKFQNLSNAYEILGSYINRKKYDRDFQIRRGETDPTFRTVWNEPRRTHHRTNVSNTAYSTGGRKIFDFDEWTRAHYSDSLETNLRLKKFRMEEKIARAERLRYKQQQTSDDGIHSMGVILATVIIIWICLNRYSVRDYDVVKYPRPKTNTVSDRETKKEKQT